MVTISDMLSLNVVNYNNLEYDRTSTQIDFLKRTPSTIDSNDLRSMIYWV